MKHSPLLFWLTALVIFSSCSTQFDVYDPPQEIYAAYSILNPSDTVQYLRIARVYQVAGDALQYGKENDLSAKGLTVKISGGGKTWTATEMDSVPKDTGLFFPFHTLYVFHTNGSPGNDTLISGTEYTLDITRADSALHITGKTTIPTGLRISDKLKPGTSGIKCLYKADLEKKYRIMWNKGSNSYGFELKVKFDYVEDGATNKTVIWGPTQVISANSGCVGSASEICYQFEKYELIGYWQNFIIPGSGHTFQYTESPECLVDNQVDLLPKVVTFEVTAIDLQLGTYMLVNNPRYAEPYGSKPEYTNLGGNVAMVGIFGSRISDKKYTLLNDCTEFLLGLDNTMTLPLGCTPP